MAPTSAGANPSQTPSIGSLLFSAASLRNCNSILLSSWLILYSLNIGNPVLIEAGHCSRNELHITSARPALMISPPGTCDDCGYTLDQYGRCCNTWCESYGR